MEVFDTVAAMRSWRAARPDVAFVDSMGGLHDGHRLLLRTARNASETCVAAIFLNPHQFTPEEDFDRYPRNLPHDLEVCESEGIEAVFVPPPEEMFPDGFVTNVTVPGFYGLLCDRFRPYHFDAIATIVLKLLNVIEPRRAYYGKKDLQQLRVIQQMVKDLDVEVEIVPVPTVRAPDGLPLSTRNAYLSPDERRAAARLYEAMCWCHAEYRRGVTKAEELCHGARSIIEREPVVPGIDYVDAVDGRTLRPVEVVDDTSIVATAVRFGAARLVDNIELGDAPPRPGSPQPEPARR